MEDEEVIYGGYMVSTDGKEWVSTDGKEWVVIEVADFEVIEENIREYVYNKEE